MPTVSMFYGVIITMNYNDYNPPHIHVKYQSDKAIVDMEGEVIEGSLPRKQLRLVQAWVEYRKDEILANWELARSGEKVYRIDPL